MGRWVCSVRVCPLLITYLEGWGILARRASLPIPESCFHLPPTAPLYGKPPGCPLLLCTLSPLPLSSQHVHAGIMPSYRSMCAYPLRITCRAHFPFEALRFTPCCLAFRGKTQCSAWFWPGDAVQPLCTLSFSTANCSMLHSNPSHAAWMLAILHVLPYVCLLFAVMDNIIS